MSWYPRSLNRPLTPVSPLDRLDFGVSLRFLGLRGKDPLKRTTDVRLNSLKTKRDFFFRKKIYVKGGDNINRQT